MRVGTQKALMPANYVIVPSGSRFTVQAFATGLLSPFGHNPTIGIRDFEGGLQFVPGTYEGASVHLVVRTNAMEVLDEMTNEDRDKVMQIMNEQILEVNRFPDAVYGSKSISVEKRENEILRAHVNGNLSFHGVTQSVSLDGRVVDLGSMLRISGEFSLRQSDYGIKPVSFAAGTLRLKDELKFNFELVARHQE